MRKKTVLVLVNMFGRPDIAIISLLFTLFVLVPADLLLPLAAVNAIAWVYAGWFLSNFMSPLAWWLMPPEVKEAFRQQWKEVWEALGSSGEDGFI